MRKYILVHSVKVATDFVPETFGRLTTIGPVFRVTEGKYRNPKQVCLCVCGTVTVVYEGGLRSGTARSCGCLRKEMRTTHGKSRTAEHTAWKAMIGRCYNPNNQNYADYGGRGIGAWGTWRGPGGFELWFAEIGPRPGKGYSQERKDVNKGYEPGNVCWATDVAQANNKRNNVYYVFAGKSLTVSQWAVTTGLAKSTVWNRLDRGWSVEDALTKPAQIHRKKKILDRN